MKISVPFIELGCQADDIRVELDLAIAEIVAESTFVLGPQVATFEAAFAEFCDNEYCVGVNSGSDALFLTLKAFGIGTGDEVISTPFSFAATGQAILRTGADVKFVDIDPATFNIDATKIESQITARCRAIVPVHLYGQPAEMDAICAMAKRYNLKVVEDAAQAHGAEYRGRKVGSLGDAACFSFYPTKNLGSWGDAGAVVTGDYALAQKINSLASHGRDQSGRPTRTGYNSRLDSIQAAVLNAKLKRLPRWNEQRRANANAYRDQLGDSPLQLPATVEHAPSVYHLYTVKVQPALRGSLRKFLQTRGIGTGVYYDELLPQTLARTESNTQWSADVDDGSLTTAVDSARTVLSLPISPALTIEQVEYVAAAVLQFFERHV